MDSKKSKLSFHTPRRQSDRSTLTKQLINNSIDSNVAQKLAESFATVHNMPELDATFIQRVKNCLDSCKCECKANHQEYCTCASAIDDVVHCVMADAYLRSNSGRKLTNKRKRSFSSCASNRNSITTKMAGLDFFEDRDSVTRRNSSKSCMMADAKLAHKRKRSCCLSDTNSSTQVASLDFVNRECLKRRKSSK